jgi:uroporphyrinogen III methyltransferase/synthase
MESYQWIIFTSANGVRFFFSRLQERGRDVRDLKGLGICTIGPATARAVEERGLRVDIVPDEYISEGIVSAFTGKNLGGKKILLPRAEMARDVVPEGLEKLGAAVDVVTVYRTVRSGYKRSDLQPLMDAGKVDVITFTSPSTVINFKLIMGRDMSLPEKIKVACLGPVTAAAAKKNGFSVDILQERYTIPGMVKALADYFAAQR